LKPKDVEGGFANRPMLLPFEGFKRPPERDVPDGMEEPPAALIKQLKALRPKLLDKPMSEVAEPAQPAPPVLPSERQKIVWADDKAKAAYFAFSREMDQWEQTDRRKFELGMRATENAVRCATNVAAGCFSPSVNQADMEWALRWSRVSFETADGGLKKYMEEYFEFPKFCEEIVQTIQAAGGFMSHRDLGRHFRRHMKHGNELDRALTQLKREDRIAHGERPSNRGPAAVGFFLVIASNSSQTE
jgi:hypothetical protein